MPKTIREKQEEFQARLLAALEGRKSNRFLAIVNSPSFLSILSALLISVPKQLLDKGNPFIGPVLSTPYCSRSLLPFLSSDYACEAGIWGCYGEVSFTNRFEYESDIVRGGCARILLSSDL
jgi:hypothetical protein